jgi:hypothetical protein
VLASCALPSTGRAGSLFQADDAEVSGQRGRATAAEGFEIVRRRLFEPMTEPGQFKDRDVVARAFADLYRTQHAEFSDNWVPVIEKDVDGPSSLPLRMDGEVPNLGKFSACRRVARAIYLGSAPLTQAAHRGVEDRRVKLGCVMPGESPAVFGDALRRLAGSATYLYQDGARYWYSTQPTVTKLAEDRAEQLKREPDKIVRELDKRLKADLRKTGDFDRIQAMPSSGQDVPDDLDARLVVLGVDHPYIKEQGSPAEVAAKAILELRGNAPRLYQNTLLFLAADKTRLQDLDEAVRKYLAWESILTELSNFCDPAELAANWAAKRKARPIAIAAADKAAAEAKARGASAYDAQVAWASALREVYEQVPPVTSARVAVREDNEPRIRAGNGVLLDPFGLLLVPMIEPSERMPLRFAVELRLRNAGYPAAPSPRRSS